MIDPSKHFPCRCLALTGVVVREWLPKAIIPYLYKTTFEFTLFFEHSILLLPIGS